MTDWTPESRPSSPWSAETRPGGSWVAETRPDTPNSVRMFPDLTSTVIGWQDNNVTFIQDDPTDIDDLHLLGFTGSPFTPAQNISPGVFSAPPGTPQGEQEFRLVIRSLPTNAPVPTFDLWLLDLAFDRDEDDEYWLLQLADTVSAPSEFTLLTYKWNASTLVRPAGDQLGFELNCTLTSGGEPLQVAWCDVAAFDWLAKLNPSTWASEGRPSTTWGNEARPSTGWTPESR